MNRPSNDNLDHVARAKRRNRLALALVAAAWLFGAALAVTVRLWIGS